MTRQDRVYLNCTFAATTRLDKYKTRPRQKDKRDDKDEDKRQDNMKTRRDKMKTRQDGTR